MAVHSRKLGSARIPALLAGLLLFAACSSSSPSSSAGSGDYTIGFALGQTGLIQPFDLPSMQTAQIAID
jgi:hypothetical protein